MKVMISSVETVTLTSKAGKSYDAIQIKGEKLSSNPEYNGQAYSRTVATFNVEKSPELSADIKAIELGKVYNISFDSTRFKNIERIVLEGTAVAGSNTSPNTKGSGPTKSHKDFRLTDETCRIAAMQIALAETAGGSPVNLDRAKKILHIIKTGEGLDVEETVTPVAAVEEVADEDEFDGPF